MTQKQTEFISMISHELSNPLGICSFQVDYIIDEINNGSIGIENIKKELSLLNQYLDKVGSLTKNLFSIEKYDFNNIKLNLEKINLIELIDEVVDGFLILDKKIIFNYFFIDNIGSIYLDKIKFIQVLDNMISNSIKFTGDDKIINIAVSVKNNKIKIIIEDNGIGLNEKNIENIFCKYKSSKTSSGLGLGLYISKQIIKLHNGSIYASNSYILGGASFIIKIPLNSF